uniref:N-acetyltransferase domain-containing protein n=1 Tax=Rhabditophanes sp. KR3021 TaxID=114890 RepID=A0AC35UFN5_9BILA
MKHFKTLEHERWAYEKEYFNVFYEVFGEDGMIFVTALEEETKKPMGCIMGTYWKNNSGKKVLFTIGTFFIVPEYRGKGLGNYLFDYLNNEALKQNIPLYLNAVANMTEKYSEKFNFNLFRDYKVETLGPKCSDFVNKKEIVLPNYSVHDHSEFTQWDKFLQFDLKLCNGVVDRVKYLRTLFKISIYSSIATNEKGDVVGCVSMRECSNRMLSVGPFYSENKDLLQLMLNKVLEHIDSTKYDEIRFNAFTCNSDLKELLSLYTEGKINRICACTLQFAGSYIPTEEKYLHCIVDLAQNFV